MAELNITYADKSDSAPLGTLQRTWLAEDANQVKNVVNALSAIIQSMSTGSAKYKKVDVTASQGVSIEHGFGRYPMVSVLDNSGEVVFPKVVHTDQNNTQVTWSEAFTGSVVLT